MVPPSPSNPPPSRLTAPPSRPTIVDYSLILCGCVISLLLGEMSGLRAVMAAEPPRVLQFLLRILLHVMLLPLGIILFWPAFYATQKLFGRKQGMTAGEWLWGLAWLATLFLVGWIAWKALGTLPEFLAGRGFHKAVVVGYLIFVLSMAGIAAIVFVVDLIARWPQPWTHQIGLVLMIWPVVPLAAIWLWKIKLESTLP